jgi:putative inorganic carbon (hco3(-)) transporter
MADAGLWALAVATAAAAGACLVAPAPRTRAVTAALALVLALCLIAADNWDDARFRDLRESTAAIAAAVVAGGVLLAGITVLLRRRPFLLAPLAIAALPFRVPLESGGDSANLLLPLYVVIAAGVAASLLDREPRAEARRPRGAVRLLPWALAAFVALYAVQSLYSDDFSQAAINIGFFLAPFAVLASLLASAEWTPRLLRIAAAIVVVEALVFAAFAFGEYAARELLWNETIIEANEIHTWFRANSLFWDPNIFGRYLDVAIVVLVAAMLWTRDARHAAATGALALVLIAALATTLSISSFVALFAGLAVLAALRWSARWTTALVGALAVAGVVAVLAGGGIEFDAPTQKSLDVNTSGRAELVRGGLELAADHPVAGLGSGSFEEDFQERFRAGEEAAGTVSHTEPVTVLAEQGAIGFLVYLGVVGIAFAALAQAIAPSAPGLRGGGGALADPDGLVVGTARAALLAALAAMFVHSLSYAAFFTDPITWVILAVGASLVRSGKGPDPLPD